MTKQKIKLFLISLLLALPSYQVMAQDIALLITDNSDLAPLWVSHHLSDQELSSHRGQGFSFPDIQTGVILWDEVDNGQKPTHNNHSGQGSQFTITVDTP